MLEATIASLKKEMKKGKDITETIVAEVSKKPLTIEEIASETKTTRAIANMAVRRLARESKIRMVSEPGKKRERFRIYPWFELPA